MARRWGVFLAKCRYVARGCERDLFFLGMILGFVRREIIGLRISFVGPIA